MDQGWLFLLLASVCFGTQYVPTKKHETFDGTLFSWFMCSGIFFMGTVLGIAVEGQIPAGAIEGLVGGALWVSSNMLILLLIKFMGMGIGFALYAGMNLTVGYCVGRLGLFGLQTESSKLDWVRDCGAGLLVASFPLLICVKPETGDSGEQALTLGHTVSQPKLCEESTAQIVECQLGSFAVTEDGGCDPDFALGTNPRAEVSGETFARGTLRTLGGALLAVFAGLLMGLNAVPFDLWRLRNPSAIKSAFVYSQALGIWLSATVVYLGYAMCQKARGKPSPAHPHIRPAFFSGCVWSVGFFCSCYAIDGLGFAVAYPLSAILPTCVSSLISMLWFKEIRRRSQVILFWLCLLLQLLGVTLIGVGSP